MNSPPDASAGAPRPIGPSSRRAVLTVVIGGLVLLAAGLAIGLTRDRATERDSVGTVLAEPIEMPDVTLPDTSGQPVSMRDRSAGRVTLLYFGYLNCPDACPITLTVLAGVMRELPEDVRAHVQVWFVSTDPDRDTPERVADYLGSFDSTFVGLVATEQQVRDLQVAVGLPVATAEPADDDGNYLVGHATTVLAFEADGTARETFSFGTRQSDWLRALPELVTSGGYPA